MSGTSGRTCGCDPGADWTCDWHRSDQAAMIRVEEARITAVCVIGDPEHDISPALRQSVTIPISINGIDFGICIYVAVSEFSPQRVSDRELSGIARQITDAINGSQSSKE